MRRSSLGTKRRPRVVVSEGADGTPAGLTIEQVSRLVDLPIPTIRSWERRYEVPKVSRTPGGHRRYTGQQLEALRRMRDLVRQGARPGHAAGRVRAELAASPAVLVEALLQAAREFQPDALAQVLDETRQTLGLGRTVDEVLLPAMRQIGKEWESGHADVSHEHLASNAVRGWLFKVSQDAPVLMPSSPIVLSCGPRDDHTLALEALHAILRGRGCSCRLLGARTPAESLARAVRDTAAVAVVVACHLGAGRQAAVDALRLAESTGTATYYAGGAFDSHQARHGVPGHYLGDNLTRAGDVIIDALRIRQTE